MNKRRLEFLLGLFEMGGGNPLQEVPTEELGKKIGMFEPEIADVGLYLKEEGLIGFYSFGRINITHEGRKFVEKIMAETHSQKERRVLEAMAETGRMSNNLIVFADIAKRLGMTNGELSMFCNGLEEKGYINFPGGDLLQMKTAGYQALEPQKPPVPTNVMNIAGNNYGAAAMGSHITQSVSNEFNEAITSLHQLVQALSIEDKDEALDNIDALNTLAAREPTTGRLDKIKLAFKGIETSLAGAGALEKAKPYLSSIWNYVKVKYNLT